MWSFGAFENPIDTVQSVLYYLQPPKWSQAGESYRRSVITAAKAFTLDIGKYYEKATVDKSDSVRRELAEVIVLRASWKNEFTTREIAEEMGISERQTRRVLNTLKKAGYLYKDYIEGTNHFIRGEQIPINGEVFERMMSRYNTDEEVQQMQKDYLRSRRP